MLKKVLITGASGMLGTALHKILPEAHIISGRKDMDLSYPEVWDYMQFMEYYDVIIHTAAITNMQLNEDYPYQAHHVHSGVVRYLQDKCDKLIYISAQGRDDKGVYYQSKLSGEKATLRRENDLVIRTNIVGDGGLAKWALGELKQGNTINGYMNSMFNPVHVTQLAKHITLHPDLNGIVNVCSTEIISKYKFISKLAKLKGYDKNLILPVEIEHNQDLTVNEEDNKTFKYNLPYEDILYS
jgi:dTDP-4-dehydrorhamnose reductase